MAVLKELTQEGWDQKIYFHPRILTSWLETGQQATEAVTSVAGV